MRFFVTKKRVSDKIRESARETDDLASRGGPEKTSRGVRVSDDKNGEKVTKNRLAFEVLGAPQMFKPELDESRIFLGTA